MERINILHSHAKQRNVTQRKGKAMEKRIYDAWDVDRETFLGILKKVRDEKLGERFVGDIDCILFRLFDLLKVGMSDNERVKKGKFELRMMFADHLAVALDILNSKIQ